MKKSFSLAAIAIASLTFAVCSPAQEFDASSNRSTEDSVKITLAIGNKVVPAVLYNTFPGRDLMAKLPVTVFLNRGPIDYCGGIDPLNYKEDDVTAGYNIGDLAYWIPGRDFVIFTDKKETAAEVPDLVIIGKISSDIREVRNLGPTIKVTIALDK